MSELKNCQKCRIPDVVASQCKEYCHMLGLTTKQNVTNERPVEPAFENENPEQWCEVLAWEEARDDKAESQLTAEREKVERLVGQRDKAVGLVKMADELVDGILLDYDNHEATALSIELRKLLSEIKGE